MKDISTQVRNTAAVVATAVTLLTGCQKRAEVSAPEPSGEQVRATLPAAPALSSDKQLAALFSDPALPAEVRSSLMNSRVHAILQNIWESGKTEQPISYIRNAYPSAEGAQTVIVLQHLLNEALPLTLEKGTKHYDALLKLAATQSSRWREDTLSHARALKSYLDLPASPLALDGDFGRRCHKRRAVITQIANITSNFPHSKEDAGANDTAIGPRTLRLLTESRPELRRYFESDFAVVVLSHNEAVNGSSVRRPAR